MSKRSANLSDALKSAAKPQIVAPANPVTSSSPRAPARVGKKAIAGFFDVEVSRQLKQIGLDNGDTSVQGLLAEALNLLFEKYGKPPIAS
jgi:hypothetical protein